MKGPAISAIWLIVDSRKVTRLRASPWNICGAHSFLAAPLLTVAPAASTEAPRRTSTSHDLRRRTSQTPASDSEVPATCAARATRIDGSRSASSLHRPTVGAKSAVVSVTASVSAAGAARLEPPHVSSKASGNENSHAVEKIVVHPCDATSIVPEWLAALSTRPRIAEAVDDHASRDFNFAFAHAALAFSDASNANAFAPRATRPSGDVCDDDASSTVSTAW
mmetsp:Transcript_32894/g.104947  ORF Transcript_32894/g.104947 Transcript_32894/m.104947 type:complete len:222 (-) Transcript_32894:37-702(-)